MLFMQIFENTQIHTLENSCEKRIVEHVLMWRLPFVKEPIIFIYISFLISLKWTMDGTEQIAGKTN